MPKSIKSDSIRPVTAALMGELHSLVVDGIDKTKELIEKFIAR